MWVACIMHASMFIGDGGDPPGGAAGTRHRATHDAPVHSRALPRVRSADFTADRIVPPVCAPQEEQYQQTMLAATVAARHSGLPPDDPLRELRLNDGESRQRLVPDM